MGEAVKSSSSQYVLQGTLPPVWIDFWDLYYENEHHMLLCMHESLALHPMLIYSSDVCKQYDEYSTLDVYFCSHCLSVSVDS